MRKGSRVQAPASSTLANGWIATAAYRGSRGPLRIWWCAEASLLFRSTLCRRAAARRCPIPMSPSRRRLCLGRRPSSREVAFGQTGLPPKSSRIELCLKQLCAIKKSDSKMAKDLTKLIYDNEPDLLYHHISRRVYLFESLDWASAEA